MIDSRFWQSDAAVRAANRDGYKDRAAWSAEPQYAIFRAPKSAVGDGKCVAFNVSRSEEIANYLSGLNRQLDALAFCRAR